MSAQQLITEHIDLWTSTIKAKNTQGRGTSKKRELYGIKKLRELILELAVRGKLVPQDPSDEPASELLIRISAEKERLIRNKIIKKPKPLPEITDKEKQFELPIGWSFCRLRDIMNVLNGRAYKKHEMLDAGTPLLRVGNLFTSKEWYYSDIELEADKYIDTGDLIYAWSASFGPFIWDGGKVIYHYHIWKLDQYHEPSVSKFYLLNYLQSITASIKASGNGIAMIHMTKERMEKLVLPIAPLSEQHRIVAKVDELMALCDQLEQHTVSSLDAHNLLVDTLLATLTDARDADELSDNWARLADHFDTLITTDYAVEQLKQTILQLAVMGKLVPQDPNDEPASELLKRIAADKKQLVKSKIVRNQKPLPIITDAEKPFELPGGWEWTRLGNLGVSSTGKTPSTKDASNFTGKIPFVGPGQITPSGELLHPEKFLSEEGMKNSTEAVPGDVLMVCIGGSIGKNVICDKRVAFNQQINAIRPIIITPSFLHTAISTERFYQSILEKSTGSATPIINRSKWEELLTPLCPDPEQHRIVAKVDELMALCDTLKTRINAVQSTQLHLADAMTGQAVA